MFQEYIDEVKKNLLQEKGGLGRALGKMGFDPTRADKQYNVCLISANRTENTPEENKKARIAMQKMLRQMGYGFNHTKGGWTEKDKEGNLVTDSEPSFLVTDIYDEPERFLQRMIALGAKFNQTDILVKLKGETEPAKYLTTTHHIDKDDDTGEETTYNIADTERTFTKAKQADIKKDPYWTQIYNKAFKLEGAELEAASQVMTLTEDQVTALYDVPFSKYGRNFSTLPQAHIAYCVLHQDLGLEDCSHSRHPYGEKWTAKAISDAHQKD